MADQRGSGSGTRQPLRSAGSLSQLEEAAQTVRQPHLLRRPALREEHLLIGHQEGETAGAGGGDVEAVRVAALADRVGTDLLRRIAGPTARLVSTGPFATSSVDALKAYLTGEKAFREARYREALDAFDQAVAVDSGFALAALRRRLARGWTFSPHNRGAVSPIVVCRTCRGCRMQLESEEACQQYVQAELRNVLSSRPEWHAARISDRPDRRLSWRLAPGLTGPWYTLQARMAEREFIIWFGHHRVGVEGMHWIVRPAVHVAFDDLAPRSDQIALDLSLADVLNYMIRTTEVRSSLGLRFELNDTSLT